MAIYLRKNGGGNNTLDIFPCKILKGG